MASKGNATKRKHAAFVKETKTLLKTIPWIENFAPSTLDELAVHKKKVTEVQSWIQKALSGLKNHSILLLTGPPGVGKTATVNVICNSLGVEMFVWSNVHQDKIDSIDEDALYHMRDRNTFKESQGVSFNRFLLQSTKYSLYTDLKRVIIVEEFPNALIKDPIIFHNILKKYTVSSTCPLIFIVSDSIRGESVENKLFPKDLQISLKVCNISFNPIAPTMLMKVLTRINNSSKVQSSYKQLNKHELEGIASDSMGDIRNAINCMQFLCMAQVFKKPQPLKGASAKNTTSKRDSSLFLFHALGKVLYCKRDASLKREADHLPANLKFYEKDPLISNPEDVFNNTAISADGFVLFLQENYLSFVEEIKSTSECSQWLSEADQLSSYWSGKETLNDYMVSVAARGLMFNLSSCSTGRRWKPLHKPQFYESNAHQRSQCNALKYIFKGSHLSVRELEIDLIPFLSKLMPNSLKPAQTALAKQLGEMNVKRIKRHSIKTLDEKDCFDVEGDDKDSINTVEEKDSNDAVIEHVDQISDEEIIIEEYDF